MVQGLCLQIEAPMNNEPSIPIRWFKLDLTVKKCSKAANIYKTIKSEVEKLQFPFISN